MKKRWEIVRCWQSANGSSTLVPQPDRRFWLRRTANSYASRLNASSRNGMWWEVRRG